MQGVATLELQFWCYNTDGVLEQAAGLMLNNAAFGFVAPVVDMSLTLQISKINVDSVQVLQSNVGKLNPLTLKLEINNGFRLVQPRLNHILSNHVINFPTNIFGIFELTRLTISYYNNYIYAGITPIFIGLEQAEI